MAKTKAKKKAKKAKKAKKIAKKSSHKQNIKKKVKESSSEAKSRKALKKKKSSVKQDRSIKAKAKEEAVEKKSSEQRAPSTVPIKPAVQVTRVTTVPKPDKKIKQELAEEREALGNEEGYSWEKTLYDMRQYEPEPMYRKPDPPQPKFRGKKDTRTRYSDKELQEFKQIILEKLVQAERDYSLLKNTLSHGDEQGTDDTSPTFKVLEDGSDAITREEVAQLASRQEKYIQSLKNALIRIENKTYGICRVTGKLIPKERLRSVPHATLSIEAKLMQNT